MIDEQTIYTVRGRQFSFRQDAEAFESFASMVDHAEGLLNNVGKLDRNGSNYRVQTEEQVAAFIEAIGNTMDAHGLPILADRWRNNPTGIIGRYMDDSDHNSKENYLYRAYIRLKCISDGKEWGQPHFAKNPNPNATELK